MIPVGRLAPTEQWDQHLLDRLFDNTLYPTGLEFKRFEGYPPGTGTILLIPGRYWCDNANRISEALSKYEWVLAVRTGDEEDTLHPDRVYHPNIRWWIQTPTVGTDYGDARFIPLGFPKHFDDVEDRPRDTNVFLSAQNTHRRRQECFRALKLTYVNNKVVTPTDGFTRGLPPDKYAETMCSTKVVPCPSGAYSPESFRVYEALEAHTIPIADDISPSYDSAGYWRMLFPDCPFPIISDYIDMDGYVNDQLNAWPASANRATAWWMGYKRRLAHWLKDDLKELGAL